MNDDLNYPTPPAFQKPNAPKSKAGWIMSLVLFILLLAVGSVFAWYWIETNNKQTANQNQPPVVQNNGPCFDGKQNEKPEGFTFYENKELGYKFAYPEDWGNVIVTTTPVAKESGKYVQGKFASNSSVTFGGNAINYTVGARDGAPLDLPGYLQAGGKYYTVELWKFKSDTTTEERSILREIEEEVVLKKGCNTQAATSSVAANELQEKPYDVARFNLQPTSEYYGVNFILNEPNTALRAEFDKIIASFELIEG